MTVFYDSNSRHYYSVTTYKVALATFILFSMIRVTQIVISIVVYFLRYYKMTIETVEQLRL